MKQMDVASCQFWLHNFESLKEDKVFTNSWVANGTSWKLTVYPNGNKMADKNNNNISLYLAATNLADSEAVNVKVKFVLPAPTEQSFTRKDFVHKFCTNAVDWGFTKFCPLPDVQRVHLFNGCLLVRVGLRPKPLTTTNESQEVPATSVEAAPSSQGRYIILRHKDQATATKSFFNTDVFSDVTITTTSGQQFRCHKVVLASASKPLAGMFSNGMAESRTTEVTIPNYSSATVEAFLQFIYRLPVELCETGQLYELCCMADQYMVTVLIEECAAVLQERLKDPQQLNVDLACSILTTHSISSLKQAHDAAVLYILLRLETAVQEACFTRLPVEAMRLLLNADPLRAISETLMLNAVLTWTAADTASRWQHMLELVSCVRFYGMCFEEMCESQLLVDAFEREQCGTVRGVVCADDSNMAAGAGAGAGGRPGGRASAAYCKPVGASSGCGGVSQEVESFRREAGVEQCSTRQLPTAECGIRYVTRCGTYDTFDDEDSGAEADEDATEGSGADCSGGAAVDCSTAAGADCCSDVAGNADADGADGSGSCLQDCEPKCDGALQPNAAAARGVRATPAHEGTGAVDAVVSTAAAARKADRVPACDGGVWGSHAGKARMVADVTSIRAMIRSAYDAIADAVVGVDEPEEQPEEFGLLASGGRSGGARVRVLRRVRRMVRGVFNCVRPARS